MVADQISRSLPPSLRVYVALTAAGGAALFGYLQTGVDWSPVVIGEVIFFVFLTLVAGIFPLPVGQEVDADASTSVLFGAALLMEPGAAVLIAVAGTLGHTLVPRAWMKGSAPPWYKHPFNAGAAAIFVGLASVAAHSLSPQTGLITVAVAVAAAVMYMANTALVAGAASLQIRINPLRFWWIGTRENGAAELGLLAFGFLGAVVYRESPWTLLAVLVPVAVIYLAFSKLARANTQLEDAMHKLEALQGRIASSAKLASVGAISMDMAHQIKNPLAILLGRLETASETVAKGDPTRRQIDRAMDAGLRIKELTETFTSIGNRKQVYVDVVDALNEAHGMAKMRHPTKAETRWDYLDGLPNVLGNPVLLREALSNLFSNAMEAVPDDGLISARASQDNGSVIIHISDNGAGIPDEMTGHLFEPFHSTKRQGSGLGLFAARHILELHDGTIDISSDEELGGTRVTVTLPPCPPPVENVNGGGRPRDGSGTPSPGQ